MRPLQWYVNPRVPVAERALGFLQDHGAGVFGDYPDTAWNAVVQAGGDPTAPNISALIAHAVMETATNRQAAQQAGDSATADMMTQRLLTLAQLRAQWTGAQVQTDLTQIVQTAQQEAGPLGFLSAAGSIAKFAALGVAVYLAWPLLMKARRKVA